MISVLLNVADQNSLYRGKFDTFVESLIGIIALIG